MSTVYKQFQRLEGSSKRERRQALAIHFVPATETTRCHCGKCRQCAEEARWDKIYREKFADPDYYMQRPVPQGSSLSWMK
jgi:hypothetical protein